MTKMACRWAVLFAELVFRVVGCLCGSIAVVSSFVHKQRYSAPEYVVQSAATSAFAANGMILIEYVMCLSVRCCLHMHMM